MKKEEEEKLEEFFNKLWFKYPTDLCKGKKGGKTPAWNALKKINPDEQEQTRIMRNLEAQIRFDRQDPDAYRWPFLSSYLNQHRYDDEVASVAELKQRTELKNCEKCGSCVHGEKYTLCTDHLYEKIWRFKEPAMQALKKLGLWKNPNETQAEWAARCRASIKTRDLGQLVK